MGVRWGVFVLLAVSILGAACIGAGASDGDSALATATPAPVAAAAEPVADEPTLPSPETQAAAEEPVDEAITATPQQTLESADAGSEETDPATVDQPDDAQVPQPLRIQVVAPGPDGEPRPVPGAHVAVDGVVARAGPDGIVEIGAGDPEATIHVVAAGYWPARNVSPSDGPISLRPLTVRAVYLPYEQLWTLASRHWALDLARRGVINAIVIDIKEEGGAVVPLVATTAVHAIDAVVDPGADMESFLAELGELGIYRIARQVVFLDRRLGTSDVETAILTRGGTQLIDDLGLGWTTPFSAKARRYNIDIAVSAARFFEEIQFDYIRFPGGPLRVHEETTGPERSAAIAATVAEAAPEIHAAGAALSIDTFGETAVIEVEDSIGQVLEALIPHVDYYSPMLYPSTWAFGSFGIEYPAAEPELVVSASMARAVERIREAGVVGVEVRPWLQDFRDYGPRQLRYGFDEVYGQIIASNAAGGLGFMLWNPTLLYHEGILALLAGE